MNHRHLIVARGLMVLVALLWTTAIPAEGTNARLQGAAHT